LVNGPSSAVVRRITMLSGTFNGLEICCGGIDEVIMCQQAGVQRIELNSGLPLGGLTPSLALMRQARAVFTGEIIAMVRPRDSGFEYTQDELTLCLADALLLIEHGADGIAFGCLQGTRFNWSAMASMREVTNGKTFVCHRAFDLVEDPMMALQELIDLGVDRILTSGQAKQASDGIALLNQLVSLADRRIEIIAGSGIQPVMFKLFVQQCQVRQWHASLRKSNVCYDTKGEVSFAVKTNNTYEGLDKEKLDQMIQLVNELVV